MRNDRLLVALAVLAGIVIAKHGIAAFLTCFAFVWFRTGPKRSTPAA